MSQITNPENQPEGIDSLHPSLSERLDARIFAEHLPGTTLNLLTDNSSIPVPAMELFEGYSKTFILPEEYQPGDFDGFAAIHYSNGDTTYLAQQLKTYLSNGHDHTEDLTYLFEMRGQTKIGHGYIRRICSNEFRRDKPFVGFMQTEGGNLHSEGDFRRQGLGARRILTMNAITHALYGLPLHSGVLISEQAQGLWVRLAEHGIAKSYTVNNDKLYAFID